MKKAFLLFIILFLACVISSCGKKDDKNGTEDANANKSGTGMLNVVGIDQPSGEGENTEETAKNIKIQENNVGLDPSVYKQLIVPTMTQPVCESQGGTWKEIMLELGDSAPAVKTYKCECSNGYLINQYKEESCLQVKACEDGGGMPKEFVECTGSINTICEFEDHTVCYLEDLDQGKCLGVFSPKDYCED